MPKSRRQQCRDLLTEKFALEGKMTLLAGLDLIAQRAGDPESSDRFYRELKAVNKRLRRVERTLERIASEEDECTRIDCRHLEWPLCHAH
jgi:hypothetical protein